MCRRCHCGGRLRCPFHGSLVMDQSFQKEMHTFRKASGAATHGALKRGWSFLCITNWHSNTPTTDLVLDDLVSLASGTAGDQPVGTGRHWLDAARSAQNGPRWEFLSQRGHNREGTKRPLPNRRFSARLNVLQNRRQFKRFLGIPPGNNFASCRKHAARLFRHGGNSIARLG